MWTEIFYPIKTPRGICRGLWPSSAVHILASQNLDLDTDTLSQTNGWNPKSWRLEDGFPFQRGDFQVPAVRFREGKPGGLILTLKPPQKIHPLLASTRNITELLGPRKPMPISFLGRQGVCDTVQCSLEKCIPGIACFWMLHLCPLKRCKKCVQLNVVLQWITSLTCRMKPRTSYVLLASVFASCAVDM